MGVESRWQGFSCQPGHNTSVCFLASRLKNSGRVSCLRHHHRRAAKQASCSPSHWEMASSSPGGEKHPGPGVIIASCSLSRWALAASSSGGAGQEGPGANAESTRSRPSSSYCSHLLLLLLLWSSYYSEVLTRAPGGSMCWMQWQQIRRC